MSDRFVLGIESAIAGGSVCITCSNRELGSWIGDRDVSRAEDLLPNIDRLLRENSISLGDLDRIIVSVGPGSFTGIKVGISTVLGLHAALGVTCLGISAMDALSLVDGYADVNIAVPMGRGTICVQSYSDNRTASKPHLLSARELVSIASVGGPRLVLHGSLFDRERFPNAIDAGWNVASRLCAAVDSQYSSTELRPLFVERKSDNI